MDNEASHPESPKMVHVMATLQPNDLRLTAAKRTYASQKETQTVQAKSNDPGPALKE